MELVFESWSSDCKIKAEVVLLVVAATAAKSLQSCPTLFDPTDALGLCSP